MGDYKITIEYGDASRANRVVLLTDVCYDTAYHKVLELNTFEVKRIGIKELK